MEVAASGSNDQHQQWTVALGNASDMRKAGLTPLPLAPGIQLVVSGNAGANSSDRRMLVQKVTTADGFVWTR